MWMALPSHQKTLELSKWNAAHDQIVGAPGTMVEASLQCELESINNVKVAWEKLKEKMHSKGIIAKLECLTSAIFSCIVSDIPASTTIMEIKDALGSIFEGEHPQMRNGLLCYYSIPSVKETTIGSGRTY